MLAEQRNVVENRKKARKRGMFILWLQYFLAQVKTKKFSQRLNSKSAKAGRIPTSEHTLKQSWFLFQAFQWV